MNFQSVIHLTILVNILAVSPTNSLAATDDTASPNVILLMSADQGWGDVGFNGNDVVKTPHEGQGKDCGLEKVKLQSKNATCRGQKEEEALKSAGQLIRWNTRQWPLQLLTTAIFRLTKNDSPHLHS